MIGLNIFCMHKWKLYTVTVCQPFHNLNAECSWAEFKKILQGSTNFHDRCEKCGSIKSTRVAGIIRK